MIDLRPLDRGHGQPKILKDHDETGERRHHGNQAEILGRQDPGQHHNRTQIQNELDALTGEGSRAAPDRKPFQVP